MKGLLLVALLLTLGGCTASYTEPLLPSDHPASPSAEEAPPRPRSHTLDLADTDPVMPVQSEDGIDPPGHTMGAPK